MWWIFVAVAAVLVVYRMLRSPYRYWVDKGVQQGNPALFLGDSWRTVLRKQSQAEMVQMVYNMFPNTRYSGFYQFAVPTLVIKDPLLIKEITVKDFDHFLNHTGFIPEDADPLWGKNLFALKDQKWRDMRTTLSPAFTSSKMKFMFSLMSESGERFVNYFLKKKENVITVELKDTFTRFTNDVIANTAFGIECDSLNERNNEFFLMGREVTDFSTLWKTFKAIGMFLVPKLFKFFNIRFYSRQVADFFNRLVKTNIESREKHGIVRLDMMHLLLEARKNGLKDEESQRITDEDITSQALVFFFAGFESVSSLMCFMSYELGVNPDVQEKLIQEVDETLEICKGKLTYEALLGMKYLDMVVSESLRKWPNTTFADRVCTKPYTIEPKYPDEKPLHLEKGTVLWLPFFGLHRDPQYYPDPDRFDPERFNDENKEKIKPYTYLPFGVGPRNCIGSRFALLETKILFFHLLSHFQIVPVQKTEIPVKLSKTNFFLAAENGFWFGLKRRVKV